jgi:metal-responsive CopG/Arc/MetJ family transcriptional regulator
MSTQTIKITLSIPQELVKVADRIAREKKTSRSRIVASCLEELVKQRLQSELEEGYRVMAKINKQIARETFEAQREVITGSDKTA